MSRFVHLNCHSNFSLLEGASTPGELIESCALLEMDALAITDRDSLYAAVPFFEAASSAGIKAIIGCDLSAGGENPHGKENLSSPREKIPSSRIILLARNQEGYRNLCRAITRRRLSGRALPLESLSEFSDGLFALCPDASLLEALAPVFQDSLYAQLSAESLFSRRQAEELINRARRLRIKCVAANPVFFAKRKDYELHLLLTAIRLSLPVTRIPRSKLSSPEAYLKSPLQMEEIFSQYPFSEAQDAIPNTREIAEACEFEFKPAERIFPEVCIPSGETPFSHLAKLCLQGAQERYRPLKSDVLERLNHELKIIDSLGFTTYFLVAHEIAKFCRMRKIPAAGRGSAAGSLVAYLLGITIIDPIEHNLYFERFLSPARSEPPDIDLDVSWKRRDEVINFIYGKFGHNKVAMICTYATFKSRAAARDVAKAYGLSPQEANNFAKKIPRCSASEIEIAACSIPYYRDLPRDGEPYRKILEMCCKLSNFPRHLSIHTGGVVISDRPLEELVPLERSAKGMVITQYDMGSIEKIGLVKMDILGQRGLSVIEEASALSSKGRNVQVNPEKFPRDDPKTFDLLARGETLGVFQIESPAMRTLLRAMKPRTISDLSLSIALVRPGASGSGMKELYLARRMGKEPITYLHPALEPILSESLGTFVYQEQVMRSAIALASFTPEEADELRRAMTHKRSKEQMERIRGRFLEGASAKIPEKVASAIFEMLAKFSSYGFPKAHAATYGEFAYQAAYLKAHFPAEFICAVLNNAPGFYHHSVHIEEAKRLGVPVALPCVNRSEPEYSVRHGVLYFGLSSVKGLSTKAINSICKARAASPFTSLSDFLSRVSITESEVANLIRCGALDQFENTRPELLWKLKVLYPKLHSRTSSQKVEHLPIQAELAKVSPPRALPRLPDYSKAIKLAMELKYLEASVSAHPLEILLSKGARDGSVRSKELEKLIGKNVSIIGWLIARRRAVTKRGEYMQFLTMEDEEGTFEVVIFPGDFERLASRLTTSRIYRVSGKVTNHTGAPAITAKELVPLNLK